jgi:hypothetical protein
MVPRRQIGELYKQRSAPGLPTARISVCRVLNTLTQNILVRFQLAIGGLSVSGYDYDKEKWVEVYKSAVFELEQSLITGRIEQARAEIVKRVAALRNISGLHGEERQAIEDAIYNLRVLEREDVKHAAEEQRKAAEAALERLRSIEARIKLPNEG